jgi:pimeloyl-ACP methyl ester carboxylesterase/DNA-binding beta-propeller fold protein YncE
LQYLEVGDVVLVEQRGYTTRGEQLVFDFRGTPQPLDRPASLDAWKQFAVDLARAAVPAYASRGIDLSGYTILECADDVDDLRQALGYRKISLVGQSFGSQWSFAIMRRHPEIVERALLSGVEPLDNGYDMPSHVFAALQRMAWDVDRDPTLRPYLPQGGLMAAVREVMNRLRAAPISVQVTDPRTNQTDTVVLGVTDFQQLVSISPRPQVIIPIYNGRYEMWAARVRDMRLSGGIGRNDAGTLIGWLIDSSTGVTPFREHLLRTDSAVEFLGTWIFDLFIAATDIWPSEDVGDEFRTPVVNRTPVLFVHGDWDTSTPIENTLGMLPYFPNAHALIVHRGTHGARSEIEFSMPELMEKMFEFLKTGRRTQLPVNVELPYRGFPLLMFDTDATPGADGQLEGSTALQEDRQPRGSNTLDGHERKVRGQRVDSSNFEVWATDPNGTAGTLYIYDGETLTVDPGGARPEVVDFGDALAALCQRQTGTAPTRAATLAFNSTGSHAIVAYAATGHVVFLDARSRAPVACIDVGAQARAAVPAPNDRYVIVANQNGKFLQRIATDYASNTFRLEDTATLNLAACTTPSGARCEDDGKLQTNVRPDNAPICPAFDPASRLVFVTLRGGGLFVVDGTATPLRIVAEYTRSTVRSNGSCGMLAGDRMFINARGGTAGSPTEADMYSFVLDQFPSTGATPVDFPTPLLILSQDAVDHDLHSMTVASSQFVWAADRLANQIKVIDAGTDTLANTFALPRGSDNPAPDLLVTLPDCGYVFATLRGSCPRTGNSSGNDAVGNTAGIGVIAVDDRGLRGRLVGIAPIVNAAPAGSTCATPGDDALGSRSNHADPHGIALRLK